MPRVISYRESFERYAGLRLIGKLFTVLGGLLLVGGGLLLAFGLNTLLSGWAGTPPGDVVPFPAGPAHGLGPAFLLGGPLSILWSVGLLVSGLQFLAIGGLFRLIIHLEENTRVTAQCLERLASRLDPVDQNVASLFRS